MKDLSNVVNSYKPLAEQSKDIVIDEFAKSIIDRVFDNLAIIFPAWKYNWKSDDPSQPDKILRMAKREWTKAFVENDISTMEQISQGFKKARSMDSHFLPSCGTFISWCKPSPEDLGYPSSEKALRLCIEYRNKMKLFSDFCARPLIVELSKRVDWWMMNTASNQNSQNKALAHFNSIYMYLINSGYKEPEITVHERLPTQEVVNSGLSEQQIKDKQKRALDNINEIKIKLKRSK